MAKSEHEWYLKAIENVLLAPPCDNSIIRKHNQDIKEAFFEYLANIYHRQLN